MEGYDLTARAKRDEEIAYAVIGLAGKSDDEINRILNEPFAKRFAKSFIPVYGKMEFRKLQAAEQIKAYRENRKEQGLPSDNDEGIKTRYEDRLEIPRTVIQSASASSRIERLVGESK